VLRASVEAWHYSDVISSSVLVPFANLGQADLVVDAVYEGGMTGTTADDPVGRLLPVGNAGGFRFKGKADGPLVVSLCSSGRDPDWPDTLDRETGIYTYYGDNRKPGAELLKTSRGGNKILANLFDLTHVVPHRRAECPPLLVFESTGNRRDNRFLGLAVPGAAEVEIADQLVAIWRTKGGLRFQNYRAIFTILDTGHISRTWIDAVLNGQLFGESCPDAYLEWIETGKYKALRAPRTLSHRSKAEQLPDDLTLLREIHSRFKDRPHEFEACAALLWRMLHGPGVRDIEVTRPSVDGGRDALGTIALGPESDPIRLDFALEAKCFDPGKTAAGVGDMKRLISRLRHRQFGVFVTTSFVRTQAYREIRDDGHPIVIVAGTDIVAVLKKHGISTVDEIRNWLSKDFRAALD
jgi:hypothetical protein